MAHIVAVQAASLSAQNACQQRSKALTGFGRILNPQSVLAVLVLHGFEILCDHLEGFIPGDNFELARTALAYALHGRLQACFAVDVLNFSDALQTDVVETIVFIGTGLNHHQATVAHGALQHAVAHAVLVVVGVTHGFGAFG